MKKRMAWVVACQSIAIGVLGLVAALVKPDENGWITILSAMIVVTVICLVSLGVLGAISQISDESTSSGGLNDGQSSVPK